MTTNKKCKKYLKAHPGATIEDWQNQRHHMHIIQSRLTTHSKHAGSKSNKTIMSNVHSRCKYIRKSLFERLLNN